MHRAEPTEDWVRLVQGGPGALSGVAGVDVVAPVFFYSLY